MNKFLLVSTLLMPAYAFAQPASNLAWTPDVLNLVKQGHVQKGEQLAKTCSSCHGDKGISAMGMFPSLAGQMANYTYKQLRDYADGKRDNAMMSSVAKNLSEQDSADLAAWFASLPAAPASAGTAQQLDKAEVLVSKGNGKKVLPPCFACHEGSGKGQKMDTPALIGQQAEYTSNTLRDYKNGTRHNDIYGRMRTIAKQLNDEEITQLGLYYQQLQ